MLDNYYGCVGSSLYNWILLGLDLVKDDVLDNHLKIYQQDNMNDVYNYYQQQWNAKEKMLPSHLAFLKSLRVP
jgi:hypothetical protein